MAISDEELTKLIARAIYSGLEEAGEMSSEYLGGIQNNLQEVFIPDPHFDSVDQFTSIDGNFDLQKVAKKVIAAIRQAEGEDVPHP